MSGLECGIAVRSATPWGWMSDTECGMAAPNGIPGAALTVAEVVSVCSCSLEKDMSK